MKSKGNRYTADTKAEIALRACREDMTLSERSSEYVFSSTHQPLEKMLKEREKRPPKIVQYGAWCEGK